MILKKKIMLQTKLMVKKIGIAIGSGVFILALVFFLKHQHQPKEYVSPLQIENLNREEKSVQILKNGSSKNSTELVNAMMSLVPYLNPERLSLIQSFQDASDPWVRAGVASVLVFQDDEKSKSILDHLLLQGNPLIRSQVVSAIEQRGGSVHEKRLKQMLEDPALSAKEKIQVKVTLIKTSSDHAFSNSLLKELISEANFNHDSPELLFLISQLDSLDLNQKELVSLNQKVLKLSKNEELLKVALRFLLSRNESQSVDALLKWIQSSGLQKKLMPLFNELKMKQK